MKQLKDNKITSFVVSKRLLLLFVILAVQLLGTKSACIFFAFSMFYIPSTTGKQWQGEQAKHY